MSEPCLIIDTREQTPWSFPPDVLTKRATLDAGDYALEGHPRGCVIERKSLLDFVGTTQRSTNWARFTRELEKLKACDKAAVIVEASVADVRHRMWRPMPGHRMEKGTSVRWALFLRDLKPAVVLASASEVFVKYGVPVIWGGDATDSATIAWSIFRRWRFHHG